MHILVIETASPETLGVIRGALVKELALQQTIVDELKKANANCKQYELNVHTLKQAVKSQPLNWSYGKVLRAFFAEFLTYNVKPFSEYEQKLHRELLEVYSCKPENIEAEKDAILQAMEQDG